MTPVDFPNRNAIGWTWSNPVRAHRIEEVLNAGKRMSLQDFATLQTDYLSGTARTLLPVLINALKTNAAKESNEVTKAQAFLQAWDYQLKPNSVAAAIYVQWETELKKAVYQLTVPQNIQTYFKTLPTKRLVDWVITPGPEFGTDPIQARNGLLVNSLEKAIQALTARLGNDMNQWQYGQAKNKHITLTHALSDWVSADQRAKINLGPLPRGGYGEVVGNTGNNLNQEHGASFRILVDTENWDKTLGINSPGQSANPDDPHYADLFELWAKDGYFPFIFLKTKLSK